DGHRDHELHQRESGSRQGPRDATGDRVLGGVGRRHTTPHCGRPTLARRSGVLQGLGDERCHGGHGWLHCLRHPRAPSPDEGTLRLSQPGTALRPLDALWEAGTIIRIILAGEALALVLALSPGLAGDRLTWFGMASFAIQWIALVAMAMLFLARRRLARASPVRVAQFALVALVASTWIVSGLAWLFLHDIW